MKVVKKNILSFFSDKLILKGLQNISWGFAEKIIRFPVSILNLFFISRYFGPDGFGVINTALAIISLAVPFAGLGTSQILIKQLSQKENDKDSIIFNGLLIHLFSSTLIFIITYILIKYFFYSFFDDITSQVTFIILLAIFASFSNVFRAWFSARLELKSVYFGEIAIFIIFSGLKIFGIISEISLINFSFLLMLEFFMNSIVIAILFFWRRGLHSRKLNFKLIVKLCKAGLPLTGAALTIMLYMKVDIIMIEYFYSSFEVGIYSAASRIMEILFLIPIVISSVLIPVLTNTKDLNNFKYIKYRRLFSSIFFYSHILIAIFVYLTSGQIIGILFGEAFDDSIHILTTLSVVIVFIPLGLLSSAIYVSEDKSNFALVYSVISLLINISLNLLFIPNLGPIGAAYATIISQSASCLFLDIFHKQTRDIFTDKIKGIVWKL